MNDKKLTDSKIKNYQSILKKFITKNKSELLLHYNINISEDSVFGPILYLDDGMLNIGGWQLSFEKDEVIATCSTNENPNLEKEIIVELISVAGQIQIKGWSVNEYF